MSRGLPAPESPALDLPEMQIQRADIFDPWILDPALAVFAQRFFGDLGRIGDLG